MKKYNVCVRCGRVGYLVLLSDGTEAYVAGGRITCRPRRIQASKKRKRK